jgi:hypothetical protein
VSCEDILTDEMDGIIPQGRKCFTVTEISGYTYVINKGVKPHIGYIITVERERNTPGKTFVGTRNTQIGKWLPQESQYFISPGFGKDKVIVLFNILYEPLLVGAHAEKVIGFLDLLNGTPAFGTASFI